MHSSALANRLDPQPRTKDDDEEELKEAVGSRRPVTRGFVTRKNLAKAKIYPKKGGRSEDQRLYRYHN
jgi:hypothetical protein